MLNYDLLIIHILAHKTISQDLTSYLNSTLMPTIGKRVENSFTQSLLFHYEKLNALRMNYGEKVSHQE